MLNTPVKERAPVFGGGGSSAGHAGATISAQNTTMRTTVQREHVDVMSPPSV
jgi:hypothetical protein